MIAIIILNCPIVEMSRPMPAHVKHLQCSVQPDSPSASVLGSDCLCFTLALSLTGDFCKLLNFSWIQTWGHREHNPREELWGWNEPCKVPETRNHSDGRCRYYYMLDLQMLFKWSTIPSFIGEAAETREVSINNSPSPKSSPRGAGLCAHLTLWTPSRLTTQEAYSAPLFPDFV